MNVGHVLTSKGAEVASVRPDDKIETAAKLLAARRTGLAVVTDASGRLLGVISAMDIMRAVGDHGDEAARMPVSAVMTSNVAVCRPQDSVQQALEQMVARRIRHLPVIDGGIVKGVIRLRDAVAFRVGEVEVEADELRRYIYGAGFH
jgi:CBS domain-containing protein